MSTPESIWVFGYGSLIWRPDFCFSRRLRGYVVGWQRRFWQGSPDHRGTPKAPGRVVTLVEAAGQRCYGVAYAVSAANWQRIEQQLDVREQGGYEQCEVAFQHEPSGTETNGKERPSSGGITARVYRATEYNEHFLGPASEKQMAMHIASSTGPSGTNWEYLERLDAALAELGIVDDHVRSLTDHCMRHGCIRPRLSQSA